MKIIKALGILAGVSFLAFVLLIGVLLFYPWPQLTCEQYLDQHLLCPTPEGTTVTEIHYFNPTLGDGSLLVELKLTKQGFEEILQRYEWEELNYNSAYMLRSLEIIQEPDERRILGYEFSEFRSVEIVIEADNLIVLAAHI